MNPEPTTSTHDIHVQHPHINHKQNRLCFLLLQRNYTIDINIYLGFLSKITKDFQDFHLLINNNSLHTQPIRILQLYRLGFRVHIQLAHRILLLLLPPNMQQLLYFEQQTRTPFYSPVSHPHIKNQISVAALMEYGQQLTVIL